MSDDDIEARLEARLRALDIARLRREIESTTQKIDQYEEILAEQEAELAKLLKEQP